VLVGGEVFYRVLAGPLPDSASAAVALRRLVDSGFKATSNDWDVRTTPLAFFLGRFESRDSAAQRMRQLRIQGVPSYVVDVPYSSGPVRYHLYGGAYSADSEAAVMRDLLKRVGLTDTLMLRLGRGSP
jgi:cell division protein FtsN